MRDNDITETLVIQALKDLDKLFPMPEVKPWLQSLQYAQVDLIEFLRDGAFLDLAEKDGNDLACASGQQWFKLHAHVHGHAIIALLDRLAEHGPNKALSVGDEIVSGAKYLQVDEQVEQLVLQEQTTDMVLVRPF